jgi:histidinol-phosphate aminotransferase
MAELVNERTRVVWIANPNNPTGTWIDRDRLYSFLNHLPDTCVAVVDEAYTEYVEDPDFPDASLWLERFPHLIVTRTFSKVHGLAALRVGYGISHPHIADLLNRARQPFNVNSIAQAAAIAALEDEAHVRASLELNRAGMRQMEEGLSRLDLGFIPSVGNFITVDLGRPAGPVDQALLRLGCITRPVANYGMPHHLRITIGAEEENSRLLAALATVLAQ